MIVLGVILILNNFSILPWGIWSNIWRFWPVMIILWGIEQVFKESWWKSIIMLLITALLLSIVIIYGLVSSNVINLGKIGNWVNQNTGSGNEIYKDFKLDTDQLSNEERRKIVIKSDVGLLKLKENYENKTPFTAYGWYHENVVNPNLDNDFQNGELSINFNVDAKNSWLYWGEQSDNTFKVELGETDVPTDLELKIVSGKAEMQFDENVYDNLTVELTSGNISLDSKKESRIKDRFYLKVVSGNADIDLGDVEKLPDVVEINVTSGNVKFDIPKDMGIRIEYDVTSGSIEIGDNKLKGDGNYIVEGEGEYVMKIKVISGNVVLE
ncbi:MAG TPA: DUF4097 family beta strand repeat-containing protein [Candidatus Dojkabacteria bacterium]|nr:DUF4097 family beta strand repeat-containing protein [Candidatus Dojkabacteria bacterium]